MNGMNNGRNEHQYSVQHTKQSPNQKSSGKSEKTKNKNVFCKTKTNLRYIHSKEANSILVPASYSRIVPEFWHLVLRVDPEHVLIS